MAFLLFLHNTKSIDVSFDNTSIRIIYERNDFILDQCALQGSPESEVTLLWENPVMIRIRIQEIFDFNPHAFAFPQFSFNIIESSLFLKLAHFFRQFIANCYLIQSIYYLIQIKYLPIQYQTFSFKVYKKFQRVKTCNGVWIFGSFQVHTCIAQVFLSISRLRHKHCYAVWEYCIT